MNDFYKYIKNPIPLEKNERFSFNIYLKTIGLSYLLFYSASVFKILLTIFGLLPEYRNPEINSIFLFFAVTAFLPLIEEILLRLNLETKYCCFFISSDCPYIQINFSSGYSDIYLLWCTPSFGTDLLYYKPIKSPIT